MAYTLTASFPKLKVIVQDLQSVIESRVATTAEESRVTFLAHDFFAPQPITNVAIFVMRTILHDWTDDDAKKILRQLLLAMENGARLVIMDTVLPDVPGAISPYREIMLRRRDITMMQIFNGREREYGEWVGLLETVDKRLRIKNKVEPYMSVLAVMEVVLDTGF